MKISRYLIIIFVLLLSFFLPMKSFAESLRGRVLNRGGVPVTGMEVRLFHPRSGVSRPRYTNRDGVFYFDYVPRVNGNYNIEYYWKGRLVYRGIIQVLGSVNLPDTRL